MCLVAEQQRIWLTLTGMQYVHVDNDMDDCIIVAESGGGVLVCCNDNPCQHTRSYPAT